MINMENNFFERIRVEQDNEKLNLLKLQRDYEENRISEKNMTEEQIEKLKQLYKEQIKDLKDKFKMYKKKANKLINNYNN